MREIKLETDRLTLSVATDEEMLNLIEDEPQPALKAAYFEMLDACRKNPASRAWYAVWRITLRPSPETLVGTLCFKGVQPDGTVELGYGLCDGFCKRGYMTETVRAVVSWAVKQPGVRAVTAETEPNNEASKKVLLASGFLPTGKFGMEGPRFVFTKKHA